MRRAAARLLLARLAAGRPTTTARTAVVIGGPSSSTPAWLAAASAAPPPHPGAAAAGTAPSRTWASSSAPSSSSSSTPPPPPPCWSCGGAPTSPPPIIFCGLCAIIQPPCPHADHFSILGVPRTFDLDTGVLEAAHRRLQAVAHPDRFARASHPERSHSADLSARANAAYAVLKSPLLRAQYMLGGTVDGDAADDGTDATDPALLLEVMEAREAVEEAPSGSPQLASLAAEYGARAAALVEALSAAFKAGDKESAAAAAVRLRYVTSIQQAIADKQ